MSRECKESISCLYMLMLLDIKQRRCYKKNYNLMHQSVSLGCADKTDDWNLIVCCWKKVWRNMNYVLRASGGIVWFHERDTIAFSSRTHFEWLENVLLKKEKQWGNCAKLNWINYIESLQLLVWHPFKCTFKTSVPW